mmetsp:Transcript_50737/g.86928  ORF Transcript_50737/g.86928 Transcript_50737/m.86928 type:complete len:92 (+) Transcript_50737:522-797(+)
MLLSVQSFGNDRLRVRLHGAPAIAAGIAQEIKSTLKIVLIHRYPMLAALRERPRFLLLKPCILRLKLKPLRKKMTTKFMKLELSWNRQKKS